MRSKKLVLFAVAAAFVVAALSLHANAQFATLDYPLAGVTDTEATAITPSGEIVGRYYTPDGNHHGFTLINGQYQTVDVPGASLTDITWVNANGTIGGSYVSGGTGYAYTLRAGQVTTIGYPGVVNTQGYGISNGGVVVGPVFNYNYLTAQGYIYTQGAFALFNVPGAQGTYPTMEISPARIVGAFYGQDNIYHGFVFSGGVFTTIDYPGATFTWITGLNPAGKLVGFYLTPDGKSHGFAGKPGALTSIDIPGATGTEANGIDPQNDVVGRYYTSDGHTHGYFLPNPGN